MKAQNPEIKILFMLRHPIERAWSALRYENDRGFAAVDLDSLDAVAAAVKRPAMRLRSDYERTLMAYERILGRGRILVGFYDAVENDPLGLLRGISEFIGVDAPNYSDSSGYRERINATPPRKMPPFVRQFLADHFGPMTERLASRFGGYAESWLSGINGEVRTDLRTGPDRNCAVIVV
jgi:hypothetical protein